MRIDPHRTIGLITRCLFTSVLWPFLENVGGAQETLIITVGENWRYLKGTEAPPENWRETDFDDSEWLEGPTGIGYGDNDDTTLLDDMQNNYLTVLTRKDFNIDNPGALTKLALRVTYDDGFVAHVNGTEIGRVNMPPGDVNETTAATAAIEPGAPTLIEIPTNLLETGRNVLAVSLHNAALASTDLSFIPELVANADACPKTAACTFTLGNGVTITWANLKTYESIAIRRNGEALESGLDGSITTYLDPSPPVGEVTYQVIVTDGGKDCPAIECAVTVISPDDVIIPPGEDWRYLKGTGPVPAGWNTVDFDESEWLEGPTGIGYGDADDLTILDDMQSRADDPLTVEDETLPGYLSILTRADFSMPTLDGLEGLILSVVYDDGFVAYLNGVEVGRANMPDGEPNEFTAALVAGEPGAPAVVTIPVNLVKTGKNVLAVAVHNAALTSTDLSFIPTLARKGGTGGGERFRRGDADDSGIVNLTDAVAILRSLFQGGATPVCADAADADDSGVINLTDAVFILRFLFQGGGTPPAPGVAACGPDGTLDDGLAACAGTNCQG